MAENNKYFTSFCSVLDDGECRDMMQKVEEGSMSNEDVYAKLIEKHGDAEIARAHLHAAKEMERVDTVQPAPVTAPPPPIPQPVKTNMGAKVRILQEEKGDVKPSILDENRGHIPNPPSAIDNLCRVCISPVSIGIFSILESWHTNDKAKIDALMEQIEKEQTNIEDIWVEILTEIPGSIDSLNRILNDLNLVLKFALNKAGEKSPRLKERFDQELAEMQGEEEEA